MSQGIETKIQYNQLNGFTLRLPNNKPNNCHVDHHVPSAQNAWSCSKDDDKEQLIQLDGSPKQQNRIEKLDMVKTTTRNRRREKPDFQDTKNIKSKCH